MGITAKPRGNGVYYFEGNTNKTVTKDEGNWTSVLFTNDSSNDIVLTINNLQMTVKADETLDEDFVGFHRIQVTVTTSSSYRIWLRE